MTDIHVESWTLNKNGDKQTTAKKNIFYPKSQFAQWKKKSFVQKGIGYQKNYIDGKKGTHIKLNFAAVRIWKVNEMDK